jgi:kynureninase
LFNSHDRSKSFTISAGIFRFVCSNGLVVAENVFESYKIKHIGERDNDVAAAVASITAIKPKLMQKIKRLESIELSPFEKESFAQSAIPLRFEDHLEVDSSDLLVPHRSEDGKDDLYTVMNVIQENLLRGNVSGVNKETHRRFTSREITSIAKDVSINQGLWDIAERIASIKKPNLLLAA